MTRRTISFEQYSEDLRATVRAATLKEAADTIAEAIEENQDHPGLASHVGGLTRAWDLVRGLADPKNTP